jgi:hypothetical protein
LAENKVDGVLMMTILFSILAACILLLYSPYFFSILTDRAAHLEQRLADEIVSIAEYVRSKPKAWPSTTVVAGLAVATELAYFVSCFLVISNDVFQYLTLAFALFECIHISRTLRGFILFVGKKIPLEKFVRWKQERTVALLFYTHALIAIVLIIWQ